MKIAQIAPLYEAVPPRRYGGTERVIAALCDGLVEAGHDVTLFAAGGSRTAAELVSIVPTPLRERMTREEMVTTAPHLHLRMLADIFDRADDFDVIHSHMDIWTMPFAAGASTPTVLTMHGRLDVPDCRQALELYPDAALVSISDHQRLAVRDLSPRWLATVYNGLDLRRYAAASHRVVRGEHLAFVGRIHPEKGPAAAIEIASRAGRQLRMAAKVDPLDVDYFTTQIEPLIASHGVDFVGEIGEDSKPEFFAAAAATLFPSDWPEPFGLVMIESMAAGTPVIALRRGSVPEILRHGTTGFICDDVDEMLEAVGRLAEIDPDDCRRHAATFDVGAMVSGYLSVYDGLGVPAFTGVAAD